MTLTDLLSLSIIIALLFVFMSLHYCDSNQLNCCFTISVPRYAFKRFCTKEAEFNRLYIIGKRFQSAAIETKHAARSSESFRPSRIHNAINHRALHSSSHCCIRMFYSKGRLCAFAPKLATISGAFVLWQMHVEAPQSHDESEFSSNCPLLVDPAGQLYH